MLIKRFKDLYKIILAGPQKYNGFLYTIRFSELNRISTDFCIRKITKEDLPKIVKLRDANVAKAFCTMLSKKMIIV